MSDTSAPSFSQRPELEQAFQQLTARAAGIDLSGLDTPAQQWLVTSRVMLDGFGDIGPADSLDGVTFSPVSANGASALWVTAEGADNTSRIVYLHGGGWSSGGPKSHRMLLATLARLSKASILFVDYRLAPEHPFPAPLDDCVAAFEWALVNGPTSEACGLAGRDPVKRLCLAGDSAGGNLAAAVCVRQAGLGGRMPDRLVLIGAALDLVLGGASRDNLWLWAREGISDAFCTPDALASSVEHYLTPFQNAANPEISPVFAPVELLRQFPPTLLQASASEVLSFDNKTFAQKLERAGVRVNLSLWPDVPHVWHGFLGVIPEAAEALGEIANFVNL